MKPEEWDVELPFAIPDQHVGEVTRSRPAKAKAYGKCPACTKEKVALLQQGEHIAWKPHNVMLNGRGRPECRASGQRVCDMPEGEPQLDPTAPVRCPCRKVRIADVGR